MGKVDNDGSAVAARPRKARFVPATVAVADLADIAGGIDSTNRYYALALSRHTAQVRAAKASCPPDYWTRHFVQLARVNP